MVRRYNYAQSVIGDCGHTCSVWPQVAGIGGSKPEIICDVCTREQYGIDADASMSVYVRMKEEPAEPATPKRESKPRKKSVRCSICQKTGHLYDACPLLVGQETLFDGS